MAVKTKSTKEGELFVGVTIALALFSILAAPITVSMMLIERLPEVFGYLIYAVELPWDLLMDLF